MLRNSSFTNFGEMHRMRNRCISRDRAD